MVRKGQGIMCHPERIQLLRLNMVRVLRLEGEGCSAVPGGLLCRMRREFNMVRGDARGS